MDALAKHACMGTYAVAPARQAGRSAAAVPSVPLRRRRQLRLATQASAGSVGAAAAATKRAFNFSAGPACLPLDVLQTAQAEMVDWHVSGMSVLEMSHRGPEFEGIIAKAEKDLRTLMKIPDNYKARACSWRAVANPAAPQSERSRCEPLVRPAFQCTRVASQLRYRRGWSRRRIACARADAALRYFCAQVMFVQGGASTQFAALPLNFAPEGATVDYVVTGAWGAKCVQPPPLAEYG